MVTKKLFQVPLREQDRPLAYKIERIIAAYKGEHGLDTLFEALAQIIEKAVEKAAK